MTGWGPYLGIKPAEVDEAGAGEVQGIALVDAENGVEGEGGDHGGEELQGERGEETGSSKTLGRAGPLGTAPSPPQHLQSARSGTGSKRKRLLPS